MIGGVWYAASSRTPSTFSGSVSLTARTVTRPLSVRAIVAGATGPGGFSLASEENSLDPFCPVWPAVETEGDIAREGLNNPHLGRNAIGCGSKIRFEDLSER